MLKTIKLRCPNCGKVLLLMDMPNIESKIVTCSSCGKSERFTDYERMEEQQRGGATLLPGGNCGTVYIVDEATGKKYKLNVGVNGVGRDAKTSKADVRIMTNDCSLSRLHSYLTVSESPNGSIRCSIANAENKFPTFVNGVELVKDDVLPVTPQDKLTLASSNFHIEIV